MLKLARHSTLSFSRRRNWAHAHLFRIIQPRTGKDRLNLLDDLLLSGEGLFSLQLGAPPLHTARGTLYVVEPKTAFGHKGAVKYLGNGRQQMLFSQLGKE